jgi:ubiquinone/menaquinone biosynthesis C-methylase UbiE
MSQYVLARDTEGAERLRMLSRVLDRTTGELLKRVGIAPCLRCLDLGCGVGEVTIAIARWVGPEGLAVGIDADAHFLDLARREAAQRGVAAVFRLGDACALQAESGYDLAYARFLLSHLPNPADALRQLVAATRPGGVIVVEDVDFSGHFSYPRNGAFTRYQELYQAVVRARGADPDLGPRLPELFEDAGIERVHFDVLLPAFRDGEGKQIARVTMQAIRQAVIAAGLATDAEVEEIVAELSAFERDRRTIMSMPRIFQVWGINGLDSPDERRARQIL